MPNSKISALTSATTPLAGTEVLPVVQSGTTKQVSVANLTAGREVLMSNLRATGDARITGNNTGTDFTNGSVFIGDFAIGAQVVGIGNNLAGNYAYIQSANFGVAYKQFRLNPNGGDVTIGNGNLIPSTAAKGVNFTANTPAAGKTTQLLNWYEEGTWTPTVTATTPGITPPVFSSTSGTYTRIGRNVYITYNIQFGSNGTGAGSLKVDGLPFNSSQRGYGVGAETAVIGFSTLSQGIAFTSYFYVSQVSGVYPGGTSYNLLGSFTYIV